MERSVKNKLILRPLFAICVGLLLALFIFNFIPYQWSKIPLLNGNEIKFPPSLLYLLAFAFTLKPILNLLKNWFLIRKCEQGNSPSCPVCGYPMVNRVAKRGKYIGQEFWGCFTYPKCTGKIHIG